jgi:hypothetical protein
VVSNAGDFQVFEPLAWRDRRPRKHRLAQFSTHELVLHTRPLCDVDGSVGRANRELRLERANKNNDMNRHRVNLASLAHMTFAKNRSCGGFLVSEYTAFVAQVLERRCCFSSKVAWQGRDQCRLLRGLSGIRIRATTSWSPFFSKIATICGDPYALALQTCRKRSDRLSRVE